MNGARAPRRIGRWTYVSERGWQLGDGPIFLDYDRLDNQGMRPGCWEVDVLHEPIDHYLDGAMEWVEEHEAEYVEKLAGYGRDRTHWHEAAA